MSAKYDCVLFDCPQACRLFCRSSDELPNHYYPDLSRLCVAVGFFAFRNEPSARWSNVASRGSIWTYNKYETATPFIASERRCWPTSSRSSKRCPADRDIARQRVVGEQAYVFRSMAKRECGPTLAARFAIGWA